MLLVGSWAMRWMHLNCPFSYQVLCRDPPVLHKKPEAQGWRCMLSKQSQVLDAPLWLLGPSSASHGAELAPALPPQMFLTLGDGD